MANHDLTPTQATNLHDLAVDVDQRALPEVVKTFLLTLRRYQLLSGETQTQLLGRAGRRGGDRPSNPTKQRASDQFRAARWSAKSVDKGVFPTTALVEVVAEHYAAETRKDRAATRDELLQLRTRAWDALAAMLVRNRESARQQDAQDAQSVTQDAFDTVCGDRDRARADADSLRERLREADHDLAELRRLSNEPQQRLAEAQARIAELLDQRRHIELVADARVAAAEARAQEADAEASAARAIGAAWEEQAMTLLRQVDRLKEEVTDLRKRLAGVEDPDGSVRQVLDPDHTGQALIRANAGSIPAGGGPLDSSGPLVPGVQDAAVTKVLDDIQAGLFDLTQASQRYPDIPANIVRYLCGAAAAMGLILVPDTSGRSWIPGRSGTDSHSGHTLFVFRLVLLTILPLSVVGSVISGSVGGWVRWAPSCLVILGLFSAIARPRWRRRLRWPFLVGGAATSLSFIVIQQQVFGLKISAFDIIAAVVLVIFVGSAVAALQRDRRVELLRDGIVQFHADQVHGPSAQLMRDLVRRAAEPQSLPSAGDVTFSMRDANTLRGESRECPSCHKSSESCQDCVTTCPTSQRSLDESSDEKSGPSPDNSEISRAIPVFLAIRDVSPYSINSRPGRVTWAKKNGDHVKLGDPIGIICITKIVTGPKGDWCGNSQDMTWLQAPADGVLVGLGRRYSLGDESAYASALLIPDDLTRRRDARPRPRHAKHRSLPSRPPHTPVSTGPRSLGPPVVSVNGNAYRTDSHGDLWVNGRRYP